MVEAYARTGSTPKVEIRALIDQFGGRPIPICDQPKWTGAKSFRVLRGRLELLQDHLGDPPGEDPSTGDPRLLAEFVRRGLREARAERVAVLMYGHGVGAGGTCLDGTPNQTYGIDSDTLTPQDLRVGFSDALRGLRARVDLVAVISCNVGCLEVLDALSSNASYVVASEALTCMESIPVGPILRVMERDGSSTGFHVGSAMVRAYEFDARCGCFAGVGQSVALYDSCAIDTLIGSSLRLAMAVDAELHLHPEATVPLLLEARARASSFACNRTQPFLCVNVSEKDCCMHDLGATARHLAFAGPRSLRGSASAVVHAIDRCVRDHRSCYISCGGEDEPLGLSFYLPCQPEPLEAVTDLAGSSYHAWARVVRALYSTACTQPGTVSLQKATRGDCIPSSGDHLRLTTNIVGDPSDITCAWLQVWRVRNGTRRLLRDVPLNLADSLVGTTITSCWDGSLLALAAGRPELPFIGVTRVPGRPSEVMGYVPISRRIPGDTVTRSREFLALMTATGPGTNGEFKVIALRPSPKEPLPDYLLAPEDAGDVDLKDSSSEGFLDLPEAATSLPATTLRAAWSVSFVLDPEIKLGFTVKDRTGAFTLVLE
jgi:hypothetical protein